MRFVKIFLIHYIIFFVTNTYAGIELACKGRLPNTPWHKTIFVNCENQKELGDKLGSAWQHLKKNIKAHPAMSNYVTLCYGAFKDISEMPPNMSFKDLGNSYLERCNYGLALVD